MATLMEAIYYMSPRFRKATRIPHPEHASSQYKQNVSYLKQKQLKKERSQRQCGEQIER